MSPQFRLFLTGVLISIVLITLAGCSVNVDVTCNETTKVTKVSTPVASAGGTIYQVGVVHEVIQTCHNIRRTPNENS